MNSKSPQGIAMLDQIAAQNPNARVALEKLRGSPLGKKLSPQAPAEPAPAAAAPNWGNQQMTPDSRQQLLQAMMARGRVTPGPNSPLGKAPRTPAAPGG